MENKTFRKTLAERLGRTAKDTDALIGALTMLLAENATALKAFAIPGFGTFVPDKHDEKIVNDLSTGHRILLPPEITLEFFPGSAFRKKIAADTPMRDPGATPAGGIMTLPAAADALASINAIGRDSAEKFLKEFFALIEEECALNGHASVKGFGEFTGVLFRPDQSLAEEVNQPFAMFAPVELDDSISESDFDGVNHGDETPEMTEEPQEIETNDPEDTAQAPQTPEQSEPTGAEAALLSQTPDGSDDETAAGRHEPTMPEHNHSSGRKTVITAIVAISLLMFIAGFLSGRYSTPKETREIIRLDTIVKTVHDTVFLKEQAQQDKTKPAVEPIYDTVTPTRYLASMARQYYGRMEYWVYIYKANEEKLGNPDKIRPGTRVKIPSFKDYATSPSDSVNLTRARLMAEEIYGRYRK